MAISDEVRWEVANATANNEKVADALTKAEEAAFSHGRANGLRWLEAYTKARSDGFRILAAIDVANAKIRTNRRLVPVEPRALEGERVLEVVVGDPSLTAGYGLKMESGRWFMIGQMSGETRFFEVLER